MQPRRPKTCYHPYVLVAFHLNWLPDNLLQIIPRSTRFDWHYRDIKNSFGHAWYQENKNLFNTLQLVAQNKKLLRINTALLRVIAIKAFIKKNVGGLNAGLASLKMVATSNIQKVSRVIGLGKHWNILTSILSIMQSLIEKFLVLHRFLTYASQSTLHNCWEKR